MRKLINRLERLISEDVKTEAVEVEDEKLGVKFVWPDPEEKSMAAMFKDGKHVFSLGFR